MLTDSSPANYSVGVDETTTVTFTFSESLHQDVVNSDHLIGQHLLFSPGDALEILDIAFTSDNTVIEIEVEHNAGTDFAWAFIGMKSAGGQSLLNAEVVHYTTSDALSALYVGGMLTLSQESGEFFKTATPGSGTLASATMLQNSLASFVSEQRARHLERAGLVGITADNLQTETLFSTDAIAHTHMPDWSKAYVLLLTDMDWMDSLDGPVGSMVAIGTVGEDGEYEIPFAPEGDYYVLAALFEDLGKQEPMALGVFTGPDDEPAKVTITSPDPLLNIDIELFSMDFEWPDPVDAVHALDIAEAYMSNYPGTRPISLWGMDSAFFDAHHNENHDDYNVLNTGVPVPTGLSYFWDFSYLDDTDSLVYFVEVIGERVEIYHVMDYKGATWLPFDFEDLITITPNVLPSYGALNVALAENLETTLQDARSDAHAYLDYHLSSFIHQFSDYLPEPILHWTIWFDQWQYDEHGGDYYFSEYYLIDADPSNPRLLGKGTHGDEEPPPSEPLELVAFSPGHMDAGVPEKTTIRFTFNQSLDYHYDRGLDLIGSLLMPAPENKLVIEEVRLTDNNTVIEVDVVHEADTDYAWSVFGFTSYAGAFMDRIYALNYTTASATSPYQVSGQLILDEVFEPWSSEPENALNDELFAEQSPVASQVHAHSPFSSRSQNRFPTALPSKNLFEQSRPLSLSTSQLNGILRASDEALTYQQESRNGTFETSPWERALIVLLDDIDWIDNSQHGGPGDAVVNIGVADPATEQYLVENVRDGVYYVMAVVFDEMYPGEAEIGFYTDSDGQPAAVLVEGGSVGGIDITMDVPVFYVPDPIEATVALELANTFMEQYPGVRPVNLWGMDSGLFNPFDRHEYDTVSRTGAAPSLTGLSYFWEVAYLNDADSLVYITWVYDQGVELDEVWHFSDIPEEEREGIEFEDILTITDDVISSVQARDVALANNLQEVLDTVGPNAHMYMDYFLSSFHVIYPEFLPEPTLYWEAWFESWEWDRYTETSVYNEAIFLVDALDGSLLGKIIETHIDEPPPPEPFELVYSTPAHMDAEVPLNTTLIFEFNKPIAWDIVQSGEFIGNYFVVTSMFDIAITDYRFVDNNTIVELDVVHEPDTDFAFTFIGLRSIEGDLLDRMQVVNYTTASSVSELQIAGALTAIEVPETIFKMAAGEMIAVEEPVAKAAVDEQQDALPQRRSGLPGLLKPERSSFATGTQTMNKTQIRQLQGLYTDVVSASDHHGGHPGESIDWSYALVLLLNDLDWMDDPDADGPVEALANMGAVHPHDGMYLMENVRNGDYYLMSVAFDPYMPDDPYIGFYTDNEGAPELVTVDGESLLDMDIAVVIPVPYVPEPIDAHQALALGNQFMQAYPETRPIIMWGMDSGLDTWDYSNGRHNDGTIELTGKSYAWEVVYLHDADSLAYITWVFDDQVILEFTMDLTEMPEDELPPVEFEDIITITSDIIPSMQALDVARANNLDEFIAGVPQHAGKWMEYSVSSFTFMYQEFMTEPTLFWEAWFEAWYWDNYNQRSVNHDAIFLVDALDGTLIGKILETDVYEPQPGTPITIVSTQPQNGAAGVLLESEVHVTFNEMPAPYTVMPQELNNRFVVIPANAYQLESVYVDTDENRAEFSVNHEPDTDYTWIFLGVHTQDRGSMLEAESFVYTTASDIATGAIKGILSSEGIEDYAPGFAYSEEFEPSVTGPRYRTIAGLFAEPFSSEYGWMGFVDGAVAAGTVQGENGSYRIENIRPGDYYLSTVVVDLSYGFPHIVGVGTYENATGEPVAIQVGTDTVDDIHLTIYGTEPTLLSFFEAHDIAKAYMSDIDPDEEFWFIQTWGQEEYRWAGPLSGKSAQWMLVWYDTDLEQVHVLMVHEDGVFEHETMDRSDLEEMDDEDIPDFDSIFPVTGVTIDSHEALETALANGLQNDINALDHSPFAVVDYNLMFAPGMFPDIAHKLENPFWLLVLKADQYDHYNYTITEVRKEYFVDAVTGDFISQEMDVFAESFEDLPTSISLNQNYPNPFNPGTTITWELNQEVPVTLRVYDLLGREVATLVNETLRAGTHSAVFNAGALSSGVYIYRLEAGNTVLNRKMMLVK